MNYRDGGPSAAAQAAVKSPKLWRDLILEAYEDGFKRGRKAHFLAGIPAGFALGACAVYLIRWIG